MLHGPLERRYEGEHNIRMVPRQVEWALYLLIQYEINTYLSQKTLS
jgi:hypothetical protein